MADDFQQYELKTDEGAAIVVDTNGDRVVVAQTSQGAHGRGAALLTPNEAHELARQIEAAASAAMSFQPAEPARPEALNPSPTVQGLVEQLGPQGVAALVAEAVRQMTPEQLASIRGEQKQA